MTSFDHRRFLAEVGNEPGVYQMYGADGELLYVGKANQLKRRLSSYFGAQSSLSAKTARLVAQIASIEVMTTRSEAEALLLENNLIKQHRPHYNILLRDDKSYPYLYLSKDPFPRLGSVRKRRTDQGADYFGPYPGVSAVRESLYLLQRLFRLRQCDETTYRHRSRPCLQYQIERCSAPCVGYISPEAYGVDVEHTRLFLQGESGAVIDHLVILMTEAAAALEYETAAVMRDRITALRQIQQQQHVIQGQDNLDVIAVAALAGEYALELLYVRDGHLVGNRRFIMEGERFSDSGELLNSFVKRYYLDQLQGGEGLIPARILVTETVADQQQLNELLSREAGRKIEIVAPKRGQLRHWLELAQRNGEQALQQRVNQQNRVAAQFEQLLQRLPIPTPFERIECYDISHTAGEATVASGVVFTRDGPQTAHYRRYHIDHIAPGDDYAAMEQVIRRRLRPFTEQPAAADWERLPQLLLIDGGRGQIGRVFEVIKEFKLVYALQVVGIAKGEGRKPGLEQLLLPEQSVPIILPAESAALHLLQRVRDEAHRFAIEGHRKRRAKKRLTSSLEQIEGLGPKRRRLLLQQFGGMQQLSRATIEDLVRVKGISRSLAERIYHNFH